MWEVAGGAGGVYGAYQAVSEYVDSCGFVLIYAVSMTSTNIFLVSHGYHPTGHDDRFLKLAQRTMEEFMAVNTPGAFLVDTFPFRTSLPFLVSPSAN